MELCIDFDGTVVTHDYPEVGKDIGAIPVLKGLIKNGHRLILWTMRDNTQLRDAVDWFAASGIPLYGIQENPTQSDWTTSRKAYGQLYIDDAALGCPLIYKKDFHNRPYVDWQKVEEILIEKQIIKI